MGQEQSHAGASRKEHYPRREPYDQGLEYQYQEEYRHRARRSADSCRSDHSSAESSGYRSGSSAFDCHSNRSSKSDYYCTSLYKNDHYKDINKELYKPVKIKDKRYKLQLLDLEKDELKSARLKSYLSEAEKSATKIRSTQKSGDKELHPEDTVRRRPEERELDIRELRLVG